MATLLDGGQHGVAGHGTLTVGEATDADILRHTEPSTLHGIEDADGRIVVDSKETIRPMLQSQDLRRQCLGIGTIVADTDNLVIHLQTVFQQGVLIAVETVFRDLELHGRAIESDALTTRFDQITDSVIGPHVVVDHYTAGVHTCTDAIVEHQRDASIDELLIVLVVTRVLGLRHDDTTDLVTEEVLADMHLVLVLLATEGHHDTIATSRSRLLDARQDRHKIIMGELWHDDADDAQGHHTAVAQGLANGIGKEVVLTGKLLDGPTTFLADAWRVFQGTRYRGHRDSKLAGYILHRQR